MERNNLNNNLAILGRSREPKHVQKSGVYVFELEIFDFV